MLHSMLLRCLLSSMSDSFGLSALRFLLDTSSVPFSWDMRASGSCEDAALWFSSSCSCLANSSSFSTSASSSACTCLAYSSSLMACSDEGCAVIAASFGESPTCGTFSIMLVRDLDGFGCSSTHAEGKDEDAWRSLMRSSNPPGTVFCLKNTGNPLSGVTIAARADTASWLPMSRGPEAAYCRCRRSKMPASCELHVARESCALVAVLAASVSKDAGAFVVVLAASVSKDAEAARRAVGLQRGRGRGRRGGPSATDPCPREASAAVEPTTFKYPFNKSFFKSPVNAPQLRASPTVLALLYVS